MMGDWDSVQAVVQGTASQAPEISIAQLLLALKAGESSHITWALSNARKQLGAPITAAGRQSYRRCYDAIINLQVVSELEMVHKAAKRISIMMADGQNLPAQRDLAKLMSRLFIRLESTLPTFRAREPILSMHRNALGLTYVQETWCINDFSDTIYNRLAGSPAALREIGRAWLNTAKIARKAKHFQTAYSAVLQAKQINAPFSYIQSCKLVKADGEGYRALQELETAIARASNIDDLYESEDTVSTAKVITLFAGQTAC